METNEEFLYKFYQCSTLANQLHVVRTTTCDLYVEESHPIRLCQRFMIESEHDAMEAAKVMIYRFGNIIIDRELSYSLGVIDTIVKVLSSMAKHGVFFEDWENHDANHLDERHEVIRSLRNRCSLLSEAFTKLGMKSASEYDNFIIQYIYGTDAAYRYHDMSLKEFCGMKIQSSIRYTLGMDADTLHHEIVEYLHQPRFIKKWIENGDNDILDYLQ